MASTERHPKGQKRAAACQNPFVGLGVERAALQGRCASFLQRTHALGVFSVIKPQSARTSRHVADGCGWRHPEASEVLSEAVGQAKGSSGVKSNIRLVVEGLPGPRGVN